jgi:hypothetical protein
MTGKQIAENLRQNKGLWRKHYYRGKCDDGVVRMCVIGLKLFELGVSAEMLEGWKSHGIGLIANPSLDGKEPFLSYEEANKLKKLQEVNDLAADVEYLIQFAEGTESVDYPLEKLAEEIKARGNPLDKMTV